MKKPWKTGPPATKSGPGSGSTTNKGRTRTGSPSIRGRISSPIPIPDHADDEFPMRHPVPGIDSTLSGDGRSKMPVAAPQRPQDDRQRRSMAYQSDSDAFTGGTGTRRNKLSTNDSKRNSRITTDSNGGSSRSRPPTMLLNASRRGTDPSIGPRDSMFTANSGQTGGSAKPPQRKKSTLRGTLGKLFGRKQKRDGSMGSSNSSSGPTPALSDKHHRSEPLANTEHLRESEPKRSTSVPITEYDRALRSHSIGPEDVLAIESVRNSLNTEYGQYKRQRSSTVEGGTAARPPSLLWAGDSKLTGLSPRPASLRDREPRLMNSSDDPDEIGRAITSDSSGLRRRSRSVSGMLPLETRGVKRRRSDEIRYWRESYDPNFASRMSASSTDPDEDTAVATSDVRDLTFNEPFTSTSESFGVLGISSVPQTNDYDDQIERDAVALSTKLSKASSSSLQVPHFEKRPTSAATITGADRLPDTSKDGPETLTMEHYATLMALLETERSARMALEVQVKKLGYQISLLTKLPAYSRTAYGEVPRAGVAFGQSSAFDFDDDDDDTENRRVLDDVKHSRGSVAFEDSGIATGSVDDGEHSESFMTPQEDHGHFEVFCDDQRSTEKPNARALSLSQLTMGGASSTAAFQATPQAI